MKNAELYIMVTTVQSTFPVGRVSLRQLIIHNLWLLNGHRRCLSNYVGFAVDTLKVRENNEFVPQNEQTGKPSAMTIYERGASMPQCNRKSPRTRRHLNIGQNAKTKFASHTTR